MSFIGVNRLLAIGWLVLGLCAPATAAEAPPPVMQEPVLGLRYDPATVKFDPLPDHVRIKCMEYANTAKWRSHLWIYALARDGARIYYVVGGYRERLHPAPSESRFELDKLGGVISIEGANCMGYGQAREVFDVRFFQETPQHVLQQLAVDHARTLAQAFGGPDRLGAELQNQGINADRLSPELREAFKPYLAR